MSSKRRRGESSSSTPAFDNTRFTTIEASDRFHRVLDKKTFVLERGLTPDAQLDGEMAQMIAERGWFTLVEQPEPAVISVVKEFYANAIDRINRVVWVRGKEVAFDRSTINAFYNLDNPGSENRYEDLYVGLDNVITRLCKPGTTWTLKANSNEKVSFPHSALSRYGKAWYAFICAKLMPTRHQNDVTKERAILLWGIVHQQLRVNGMHLYDVDVGMIIQESIDKFLRGSTTGGLPHGFLIMDLCRRAGVQWQSSEKVQLPMAVIDHLTIEKYKAWDGGISHPRGEGYIMMPPPEEEQHEAPEEEHPSAAQGLTQAQFRNVMRQVQRRMDRQNSRLAQRQDEMHAYNVQSFTALATAFARFNPGETTVHLPDPTPLPTYPPSDDHAEVSDADV